MTKTEIAKTIIEICRRDASFCKDVEGGDAGAYLSCVADDMPEKQFLFATDRYLASFRIDGHLYFYSKKINTYSGFCVRRYGDSLYVTRAEKTLPIKKGDEIIAVDGTDIEKTAAKFPEFFDGVLPDRQGDGWEKVVANAETVTVRAEKTFDYQIRTNVKRGAGEPSCEFKFLNDDTYYIKFTNFFDDQDVSAATEIAGKDVIRAENLILDLRNNCGGNDTEFLPLLKFLLRKDDVMCGKPVFAAAEEVLYTERNAKERIRYYEEYLNETASEDVRAYLTRQIDEQKKNMGKGFLPAEADGFLFPKRGTDKPRKAIVLTDYYCASSAESLVDIAKRLQKVTVVGRPTMGLCDYSNLARVDFGEYVLHYPTSRSKSVDLGKGTRGKGIEPDIFVPWTPKHIFEDVDVAAALDLLKTK